jgi:hypothetical protein
MAADGASSFGPGWEGWQRYQIFAEAVKKNLRYVRSRAENDFLESVLGSCKARKLTIPAGHSFWRARKGCESKLVIEKDGDIEFEYFDEEQPYSEKEMKPISSWQSEGRANPRGIPYLYLATTRDTALAEIRPWVGSTISVAQFRTNRDLDVIDCSKHHSMEKTLGLLGSTAHTREDGIWIAIDQAFATPMTRDDESGEYIPTQIIAEMFKCEGYDGITYKSFLSDDGFNLVLFNLSDADVEHCALYRVASISFDFQRVGEQYVVR